MTNKNDSAVNTALRQYHLSELASLLDVAMAGDDKLISGIATLKDANQGQITFLSNPKYRKLLADTQASAVVIHPKFADSCPVSALVSDDPYYTYARLSLLFDPRPALDSGIASTASVHPSATIGEGVSIGHNVVIEEGVIVGAHSTIGHGVVIESGVSLGKHCKIAANATLCYGVKLGDYVNIHSGVVIGSDGFGFAPHQGKWQKIAQIGAVTIGNHVDIGANTTIDRGAIDDTVISDHVILDNQIQVAHNVFIGEGTVMAGCSAIAGSTSIGKYCQIGGAVGIVGHLEIVDRVTITAMSLVTGSINQPGVYSSGTGLMPTNDWRKRVARFRQLDDMAKRLKQLEKSVASAKDNNKG